MSLSAELRERIWALPRVVYGASPALACIIGARRAWTQSRETRRQPCAGHCEFLRRDGPPRSTVRRERFPEALVGISLVVGRCSLPSSPRSMWPHRTLGFNGCACEQVRDCSRPPASSWSSPARLTGFAFPGELAQVESTGATSQAPAGYVLPMARAAG